MNSQRWNLFPIFPDEDKSRNARLLVIVLAALLAISIVLGVAAPLVHSTPLPLVVSAIGLWLFCAGGYFLARRGQVRLVSITLTAVLWIFFTGIFLFSGGIRGPGPFNYISVITIAALLLGIWAGIGTAVLSLLVTIAILIASSIGLLPQVRLPSNPLSVWMTFSANIFLAALFVGLSVRGMNHALSRARESEVKLLESNRSLQKRTGELEHREAELKRTQEQLLQSQKMEAVGKLAGGVAHDFNNLLTAIHGYADLLLQRYDSNDPEYADLEGIREATQRAADLTQQLLAFSRRQVLQPQVLNFNEIVTGLERMLRRLIGEHIELIFQLESDLESVKADPSRMEQVIMNLVLNARDAMPKGGQLIIETANTELDDSYAEEHPDVIPGRYILVAVSDTGIGMDKKLSERAFEPFYTTKMIGEGSGLGLSTVYGIVKQSGGHVWVCSEPNRGSTFKVYLPLVPESSVPLQREHAGIQEDTGTETILLVEDEESVRKLITRVLRNKGFTIISASEAAQALDLCRDRSIIVDMLVTDVVIPGGSSGPELAEKLKTMYPEIRILYISGYTDNAILHHGVLDPGIHFLQKPFAPAALTSKIRQVLDGSE